VFHVLVYPTSVNFWPSTRVSRYCLPQSTDMNTYTQLALPTSVKYRTTTMEHKFTWVPYRENLGVANP
jgi:hypothetical protein